MAKLKHWQDFEDNRDSNKPLIIYGAGKSGRHFLNVNGIIPDRFCDRSFELIKEVVSEDNSHTVPCVSMRELIPLIAEKGADVLVSVININAIVSVLGFLDCAGLPDNCVFYFYHKFDFAGKAYVDIETDVKINDKFVFDGMNKGGGVDRYFSYADIGKSFISVYGRLGDDYSRFVFMNRVCYSSTNRNYKFLRNIIRTLPEYNELMEILKHRPDVEKEAIDFTNRDMSTYADDIRPMMFTSLISKQQYFDLPYLKFGDNEVFIDAGPYDGANTRNFINACKGKFNHVFMFEPDTENYEVCRKNFSDEERVTVINSGLWSKRETLRFFDGRGEGNYISTAGNSEIETVALTDFLDSFSDTKTYIPTYIKMDIEGAEMEALKGMERIVRDYKPQMAISIYHKLTDIFDIPNFLLSCYGGYTFYLKHYTHWNADTVLFAVPE